MNTSFSLPFFLGTKETLRLLIWTVLEIKKYVRKRIPLIWLQNYLRNEKQRVCCDGVWSVDVGVNTGVPQGSILEPRLFMLHSNHIKHSKFHLLINDTVIHITHNNVIEIETI